VLRVSACQGLVILTRITDVSSSAAAVDMLLVSVLWLPRLVRPSFCSFVGNSPQDMKLGQKTR
jgi:hypothetical protein